MSDLPYRHDVRECMAEAIGAGGLDEAGFAAALAETGPALDRLRRMRDEASHPFITLPARRDDLQEVEASAHRHHEAFDTVVVLGTGGSSLSGQCLVSLRQPRFPGAQADPRVLFVENVDPRTFHDLFRAVSLPRTGFIVISKSGGTGETLAQFLVCLDAMREAVDADRLPRHFTIVTQPGSSPLRRMAEYRGMRLIDHDPKLGGRFSALSVTGLLPSMILGLDAEALREGAQAVVDASLGAGRPEDAPPAVGAAVQVALARSRGVGVSVLMPYCDRLGPFGNWYRQLWAESLGKHGNGTTPVRAMGTVDQHSQLQLYLDGPPDKLVTFLTLDRDEEEDLLIAPEQAREGELDWLIGRSIGELLDAEARATAETLAKNGRPVRRMSLPALDERAMGALMMHFMLETVIAAHLLGVDPFDQPAVEQGKVLTKKYMAALTPRA